MAAMAWRRGKQLRSQLAAPAAASPLPAGVNVNWLLGTTVLRNWIPLLPYTAADQSLMLGRGGMYDPTSSATPPLVPSC
jgi:hypothetical protein